MTLREERGDLFELDKKYALAHCISLDCEMGAGIAVEFNERFPAMKKEVLHLIKYMGWSHPLTIEHWENDRYVFNLITKEKYWNKPTYATISVCIKRLAWFCREDNIKYLAMPKIGCGLDKLKWNKVKAIIEHEFKDMDIEILVRYL